VVLDPQPAALGPALEPEVVVVVVERLDSFPKVCESSPELAAKVRAKYPDLYR